MLHILVKTAPSVMDRHASYLLNILIKMNNQLAEGNAHLSSKHTKHSSVLCWTCPSQATIKPPPLFFSPPGNDSINSGGDVYPILEIHSTTKKKTFFSCLKCLNISKQSTCGKFYLMNRFLKYK